MADMNALVRNPYVLGGAVVVVIAAALAGGYFMGEHKTAGPGAATSGSEVAAARGVCEATLDRVVDFGIAGAGAKLVSTAATATDTKGRVVCSATADGKTLTMTVDVLCDNMGDDKCLQLYKVTDSSGAPLFQRTEFLPPEG